MALVNDGLRVTPGSGATVAFQSPGGSNTTAYQVTIIANATGQPVETMPTYGLNIPQSPLAGEKYHWELFNHPSSGKTLTIRGLWASPELSVTNNATSPERYEVFRTTAVSSGGTASASFESSTTQRANFWRLDTNDPSLSSHISAKTTLTSITTGSFLWPIYVSSVATSSTPQLVMNVMNQLIQGVNWVPQREFGRELGISPGTGIALRQRNVVGLGSIGWLLEFTIDP